MSARRRLLLWVHLGDVDAIDAALAELDTELCQRLGRFRGATAQLNTGPGSARSLRP